MNIRRILQREPSRGRLAAVTRDYDDGHRAYVRTVVEREGAAALSWLRTKPFGVPVGPELARCLHSFGHVVELLALRRDAAVLDIGCGPGWLSEFLVRCGYDVTGVDISEDMVAIARARIAALAEVGHDRPPRAAFAAMPVRELPWTGRFDAAVVYDALHHFDDEVATLDRIASALVPGGLLYVHEGVRPPVGSEAERSLIDEMREVGTLEAPFDPDYLVEVLGRVGFANVTRFVEVDVLATLPDTAGTLAGIEAALRSPQTNTILAQAPVAGGPLLAGRIEPVGEWGRGEDGHAWRTVKVTNTGAGCWRGSRRFPFPVGSTTLGPYVETPRGRRELPRIPVPTLPPGAAEWLRLELSPAVAGDAASVCLDLVCEGRGWFGDEGWGEPARLELPARLLP